MICFEVRLNGKKVCLAGVGDSGVLSAIVSWAGPPTLTPKGQKKWRDPARLHVGGLYEPSGNVHIHPRWAQRKLRPGDEVQVRLIESDKPDKARHKTIQTDEQIREQQRRYYLEMKKRFEDELPESTTRRGKNRRAKPRSHR